VRESSTLIRCAAVELPRFRRHLDASGGKPGLRQTAASLQVANLAHPGDWLRGTSSAGALGLAELLEVASTWQAVPDRAEGYQSRPEGAAMRA
jgi:hypothetical protein